MEELNEKLKQLALRTMFRLSDEEMPMMIKEYEVFMHHVKALEAIDTEGVDPLYFPYELETTFLREDDIQFDADPMQKQETIELVKAYYKISNRKAAKHLFDLIVTMSKTTYNNNDDE